MANEERIRERDLILGNGEYSFVQDTTKGNINVYVGPYKASLSQTDNPVIFNQSTGRFDSVELKYSKQTFCRVLQNNYVVLENPTADLTGPKTGTVSSALELESGRKVNITGPKSFALWPGQTATVIEGHKLKSNQYLLVRVYDEKAAKENWNSGVLATEEGSSDLFDVSQIRLGKLFIIKGTDVSFYIPPTGIEVVKDENGNYIRSAVTLERLEYAILKDENGNKRYEKGPSVVFPKATESFISREVNGENIRAFRGIELSDIKGLYIKVIAEYTEDGKSYKEGEEIFITGKDQKIYYPRPEHAIIRHGKNDIQYAVTIPAGEGRYVLDKNTGEIRTEMGPAVFMPDPRHEVLVKRILPEKLVGLWFPGNTAAIEYNKSAASNKAAKANFASAKDPKSFQRESSSVYAKSSALADVSGTSDSFAESSFSVSEIPDSFDRSSGGFAPPPTITLDTRFEGAVQVDVWNGFAVQVISKTGARRTVIGPQHIVLGFDEVLEEIIMPYNVKTVYLKIKDHKVEKNIVCLTKDKEQVQLKAALSFEFVGKSENWFTVQNVNDSIDRFITSAVKKKVSEMTTEELLNSVGTQEVSDSLLSNGIQVTEFSFENIALSDSGLYASLKAKMNTSREEKLLKADFLRKETEKELEAALLRQAVEFEKNRLSLEKEIADLKMQNAKEKLVKEQELQEMNLSMKQKEHQFSFDLKLANDELDSRKLERELNAYLSKAKTVTPEVVAVLKEAVDKGFVSALVSSVGLETFVQEGTINDILKRKFGGTTLEDITKAVKG